VRLYIAGVKGDDEEKDKLSAAPCRLFNFKLTNRKELLQGVVPWL